MTAVETQITVSILGLGAEGSVVFRALCGKPCHVRILARGERAQRLRQQGITINGETYPLHVAEPGAELPPQLLIVSVKSYQLSSVLEDIAAETGPDTVVMSLLNGLSSERILADRIGPEHLIYCMSQINAKKHGQQVEFQPVGQIWIGERDGTVTHRIRSVCALLNGWVPCRISQEIILDIWKKYLFNASYNTVQAIVMGPHLWFQRVSEARAAVECVMEEMLRLANAQGVPLTRADLPDLEAYIKSYPPDGICSTAQDLREHRPTEIEMLIGESLELAAASGVEMPVCRFVRYLVKTLEVTHSSAWENALRANN